MSSAPPPSDLPALSKADAIVNALKNETFALGPLRPTSTYKDLLFKGYFQCLNAIKLRLDVLAETMKKQPGARVMAELDSHNAEVLRSALTRLQNEIEIIGLNRPHSGLVPAIMEWSTKTAEKDAKRVMKQLDSLTEQVNNTITWYTQMWAEQREKEGGSRTSAQSSAMEKETKVLGEALAWLRNLPHIPATLILRDQTEVEVIVSTMSTDLSGAFGKIYQGAYKSNSDNPCLAFKRLLSNRYSGEQLERRTENEERVWTGLNHPNILKYIGRCKFEPRAGAGTFDHLVSPFIPDGNLRKYLHENPELPVEPILLDIASALLAIHKAHIVHGDMKPDNVIFDREAQKALVCDFGLSKEFGAETSAGMRTYGTEYYKSPERIRNKGGRSPEDDVWAFGCTMAEIARPDVGVWDNMHFETLQAFRAAMVKSTEGGITPRLPADDREIWSLIKSCLTVDAARRPTMTVAYGSLRAIWDNSDRNRLAIQG